MDLQKKIESLITTVTSPKSLDENRMAPAPNATGLLYIPNTKPELLEFMSNLKPQVRISDYYVDVYEEAVNRAKRLFPNDPVFLYYTLGSEVFISEVRNELKERHKEEKEKRDDKSFIVLFAFVLLSLLLCGWLVSLLI